MIGLIILCSLIVIGLIALGYLHHHETLEDHAKEIEEYEKFLDLLVDGHKEAISQLRAEYKALEQGRDEETECYQQDMLDLQEHIALLQAMISAFINSPVGANPLEVFKNYKP